MSVLAEDEAVIEIRADVIQDVAAEIEEYVRLQRCRMFKDADALFIAALHQHVFDVFAIAAEHCECLSTQGNYAALQVFVIYLLDEQNKGISFLDDERLLLRLYQAWSETQLNGSVNNPLRLVHESQNRLPSDLIELDEVQIQMHILTLKILYSDLPETKQEADRLFLKYKVATRSFSTVSALYCAWFQHLCKQGNCWEANELIQTVFTRLQGVFRYQLIDFQLQAELLIRSPNTTDILAGLHLLESCYKVLLPPRSRARFEPAAHIIRQILHLRKIVREQCRRCQGMFENLLEVTSIAWLHASLHIYELEMYRRLEDAHIPIEMESRIQILKGLRNMEVSLQTNEDWSSLWDYHYALCRYDDLKLPQEFENIKRLWKTYGGTIQYILALEGFSGRVVQSVDADLRFWVELYSDVDRWCITSSDPTKFLESPSIRRRFLAAREWFTHEYKLVKLGAFEHEYPLDMPPTSGTTNANNGRRAPENIGFILPESNEARATKAQSVQYRTSRPRHEGKSSIYMDEGEVLRKTHAGNARWQRVGPSRKPEVLDREREVVFATQRPISPPPQVFERPDRTYMQPAVADQSTNSSLGSLDRYRSPVQADRDDEKARSKSPPTNPAITTNPGVDNKGSLHERKTRTMKDNLEGSTVVDTEIEHSSHTPRLLEGKLSTMRDNLGGSAEGNNLERSAEGVIPNNQGECNEVRSTAADSGEGDNTKREHVSPTRRQMSPMRRLREGKLSILKGKIKRSIKGGNLNNKGRGDTVSGTATGTAIDAGEGENTGNETSSGTHSDTNSHSPSYDDLRRRDVFKILASTLVPSRAKKVQFRENLKVQE